LTSTDRLAAARRPRGPQAQSELSFEASGGRWAIKHGGGYLGYARSEREARLLVEMLSGAIRS
jgi:hypothetical protein